MKQFAANQDRSVKTSFTNEYFTADTPYYPHQYLAFIDGIDIYNTSLIFVGQKIYSTAPGIFTNNVNTVKELPIPGSVLYLDDPVLNQSFQTRFYIKKPTNENVGFNDLYLDSSKNIAVVSDEQAIQQSVTAAIWLCLGDYDFNTTRGIPWINLLNGQPIDKSLMIYYLREAVLGVNAYIPETELQFYKINDDVIINLTTANDGLSFNIDINYALANGRRLNFNANSLQMG